MIWEVCGLAVSVQHPHAQQSTCSVVSLPSSLLSTSCIWMPAFCRFGSSLTLGTECRAPGCDQRNTQADQSCCSMAEDVVSLCLFGMKTLLSLCVSQNRRFFFFFFCVYVSKEYKQGNFYMAAAGDGWPVVNAACWSSGCCSISCSWGDQPGIPHRKYNTWGLHCRCSGLGEEWNRLE